MIYLNAIENLHLKTRKSITFVHKNASLNVRSKTDLKLEPLL